MWLRNYNLSIYWKILIGLVILYYGYVFVVLKFKKKKNSEKKPEKLVNYQINTNLVNNSFNEQSDLEAILNQVDEAENNSKLLDAFTSGSSSEDSNSLTRKKHEKLKIIREDGEMDPEETNTDS